MVKNIPFNDPKNSGSTRELSFPDSAITSNPKAPIVTFDVLSSTTGQPAFTNQNANEVFAGPASGAAAAPTFRPLEAPDLPLNVAYLDGPGPFTAMQTLDSGVLVKSTLQTTLATASTQVLGAEATVGKIPVRDDTGTIIGYLPLYADIT